MPRRTEGTETWHRLIEWDHGQAAAERLAAIILSIEGFRNIDPSHPLGGPDGLKDMTLSYAGQKWVGAVYFPRGQKTFTEIKEKYEHDLGGVEANGASGIAFVTNQEVRLSERKELQECDDTIDVQIYHLEALASMLNRPQNYGVRLEFLSIEMSKEEQLSYFATHEDRIANLEQYMKKIAVLFENKNGELTEDGDEWEEFSPRSIDTICIAEKEFLDKIWFDRHLSLKFKVEHGKEKVDPKIWKGALAAAQSVIEQYGEKTLGPYSSFEWGMLNGKLSALRWVLGDEWDMLDT